MVPRGRLRAGPSCELDAITSAAMPRRWTTCALVGAAVIAGGALAGCGSTSQSAAATSASTPAPFVCPASAAGAGATAPGPTPGRKLNVVTTVAPVTSIVANVAGDRATVTGVIPEGQD